MKIKICGITNIDDAKLCADLGADALGFIFYKKSKRYIDPRTVKSIVTKLPPFINKVGVFVNEDSNLINEIAKETKINSVQLHGDESVDYIKSIDHQVIKSFRVENNFDFNILNQFKDCSFLLDKYHHHQYGGTGMQFNWGNIPENIRGKIILAGGVSIENIEFIYNEIVPYAVDVSSSIEIEPGKKDHIKLNRLFEKFNELRKS